MWRIWNGIFLACAALLCVTGCRSDDGKLRPPQHPEEFNLPPADDARFTDPVDYPKNTLNQDYIKKDKDRENKTADGFPKGMPHFGSGSGGGY